MLPESFLENLDPILDADESIHIYENIRVQKQEIPLLLLHHTGLYFFFDGGSLSDADFYAKCEQIALQMQRVTGVIFDKMRLFAFDAEGVSSYYDTFTKEVETVDAIRQIETLLKEDAWYVDVAKEQYVDEVLSSRPGQGIRTKTDADGQKYILRHGRWFPLSEEDTREVFEKTMKYGWFGWYRWHIRKRASAVLYFFTLGLAGIGWFLDLLYFLVGIAKDEDGKYYYPLYTDKSYVKKTLICLPLAIGLCLLYYGILLAITRIGH